VISQFVQLRKRGKNYIGLCPFHKEKTPSFNVNPQMQIYKCFGCGKGGNVFTFLMEVEKVSYVESIRTLAERYGISIPQSQSQNSESSTDFEQLYNVLRFAGNYYYTHLYSDDRKSKFIREDYFKEQRGLNDETMKTFALGASPDSWTAFVEEARKNGFADEIVERAGLVKKRDDGSLYDAFRNRAMFPILNVTGRVVGFGARKVFEDDPLAKYINSPESPVYNKSKILYGLFQAKDEIRKQDNALLVEGYMDLISLYQHGVKNVVASSGTSLTEGQIELLSHYTHNIIIVYDADSAGAAAAMRGVDLLLAGGFHVHVLSLPGGDDPDTYVQREGKEAFIELADRAESFLEYKARQLQAEGKFDSPEKQAHAIRQLVETISKIPDALERTFFVRSIAEKFHLYETDLLRELEKLVTSKDIHERRARINNPPEPEAKPARPEESAVPSFERDLLRIVLKGGAKIADYVFGEIPAEQLHHPLSIQLAKIIRTQLEKEGAIVPEDIMNEVSDPTLQQFAAGLMFEVEAPNERWETYGRPNEGEDVWRVAQDSIRKFRLHVMEEQKRALQEKLKEEKNLHPADSNLEFLVLEIMELDKKMRELDARATVQK
jgi:DNA primase